MRLFALGLLGAVNLVAFILMGLDKRRAIRGCWRIPERTLFLWAILGGALGAYAGMHAFHHKTRKPLFRFGLPALCVLEAAALVLICLFSMERLSFF